MKQNYMMSSCRMLLVAMISLIEVADCQGYPHEIDISGDNWKYSLRCNGVRNDDDADMYDDSYGRNEFTLSPNLQEIQDGIHLNDMGVPDVCAKTVDPVYNVMGPKVAMTKCGTVQDDKGNLLGIVKIRLGKTGKKGSKVSGTISMLGSRKIALKSCVSNVNFGNGDQELFLKGAGLSVSLNAKYNDITDDVSFSGITSNGYLVDDAVVGGGYEKMASFFLLDRFPDVINGVIVNTECLPNGESIKMSNSNWTSAEAATVKYAKDSTTGEQVWLYNGSRNLPETTSDMLTTSSPVTYMSDNRNDSAKVNDEATSAKTNMSALKLSYAPKTGEFKGTFKVYTVNEKDRMKTLRAKVSGFVVDGVGYGTATIKGENPLGVVVK